MNEQDRLMLQKKLESLRDRVRDGIDSLEKESLNNQRESTGDLSGYSFHMADVATDNYGREFNLDLVANEHVTLNDIEHALHLLAQGTYGTCEECNEEIPLKRLNVVPYARKCISCQTKEEQRKGFK